VQPVAALQITQNRLANAQRIARLGNWEWVVGNPELIISDHARAILGIEKGIDRLSFERFIECAHLDDRKALSSLINEVIKTHFSRSIEHRVSHSDGSEIAVYQDIEVESGAELRVVGTIQDISLRKTTEQRIKKLAYYDPITGLANRTLLNQLSAEAIELAEATDGRVGFVFLDLDHFKRINDTFGHDAGDELLRQVADRLHQCVRINDSVSVVPEFKSAQKTVSRLGGDEFIILLTHVVQPEDVRVVVKRVIEHLNRKFTIEGKDVFISGSLGISLYPDNGDNVDDLLRHADAAMYHAKNNGRNRFEFFTSSIESDIKHRLNIETRLHQALEHDEFILHYQPRIDLQSNRIVAVEALIRWLDPIEGLICPDQFIPVAEDTGLIIPIGEWVLSEACRQLAEWRDLTGTSITMSINLSPVQFNAADLLSSLRNAIQSSGIDPHWIELELTENALFKNIDASVQLANEFKALGIRLSIDDFGTGYSSLQHLKRFPVDTIKIDRSFIRDILTDVDDALIVKSSISLGQNLRLRVVAEGVENEGQLAFLRKHRCDEVQGYLFGRPQSAGDMGRLLIQSVNDNQPPEIDANFS
jgi:diguanylate cyclase (GGDEF)-like protein